MTVIQYWAGKALWLCLFCFCAVYSLAQSSTLNWQKIDSKEQIVRYCQVIEDSLTNVNSELNLHTIDLENGFLLSRKHIRLLQSLISDSTNFTTEDTNGSGTIKAEHAFVIMIREKVVGIIYLSDNGKLWEFYTDTNVTRSDRLSMKGIETKEILFKEFK